MSPREALDRFAALCDRPGMARAIWPDEVRAVLAEVSPAPGGVLDRDQARAIIDLDWKPDRVGISERALDYLAACVRPAAIDRDALVAAIKTFPWAMSAEEAADRLITLALVRPVAGGSDASA